MLTRQRISVHYPTWKGHQCSVSFFPGKRRHWNKTFNYSNEREGCLILCLLPMVHSVIVFWSISVNIGGLCPKDWLGIEKIQKEDVLKDTPYWLELRMNEGLQFTLWLYLFFLRAPLGERPHGGLLTFICFTWLLFYVKKQSWSGWRCSFGRRGAGSLNFRSKYKVQHFYFFARWSWCQSLIYERKVLWWLY